MTLPTPRNVTLVLRLVVPVALAAALAACGGRSETGAIAGEPISFVELSQAASGSADATSGRFAFSFRAETPELEEDIVVGGEGAFDALAGRASFTVDLSGFMALLGGIFSGMPGAADLDDPDLWTIDTIRDGSTTYVRLPALASVLPPGKSWVKAKEGEVVRARGFRLAELEQLTQPDPKELLAVLEALERLAGELEVVGEETLRGVSTTHYRATVDSKDVARAASEESGKDLGPLTDQIVGQSGISEVPIDVWIDSAGLVRKLLLDVQGTQPGGSAPSRATVSFELWDLGEPVEIELPPASEVIESSALRR